MTRNSALAAALAAAFLSAALSGASHAAPPAAKGTAAQAPAQKMPARKRPYHSLRVEYTPGGKAGGWFYPSVRDRKFAIDKKFKQDKLFSSLEILGSIKEQDGRYLVDSWVQLEISTSPTGGAGMDAALLRTVYLLSPGKRTQVYRSPSMSLWLQMDEEKKVSAAKKPASKPAQDAKPGPGGKK